MDGFVFFHQSVINFFYEHRDIITFNVKLPKDKAQVALTLLSQFI